MKYLKKAFKLYIFNNIHVALAVFSLTKITLLKYNIVENYIPLFTLFSTILSYNFIRYYQIHEIKIGSWLKTQKQNITILSWISFAFLFYLMLKVKLVALFTLIPFFLATVFYVVPLASNRSNLRNIATLKLFLIAISWTGVTVVFPIINYGIPFQKDIYIHIMQVFLFIIGITIPFDIRDIQRDNPKIRTLPQVIGLKKSKFIGLIVLSLFFLMEFLKDNTTDSDILIKLIISTTSMVFLIFANDNQPKYYSSFWIESLPIFWLVLEISLH